MALKILCVCHAGKGVGLGHLARTLVAAKGFRQELGVDIQLLIQGDQISNDDLSAFPHRFISPDQDLAACIQEINLRDGLNVTLFDLHPHRIPFDFDVLLDKLRASACRLVGIDGLLWYRPKLDLIFIPSFHFRAPADMKEGAPIVFGLDCFLLDTQWAPCPWSPGSRVLALTGGSDATQLGVTWPDLLNQSLPVDVELHWVTGPFAARPTWPATPRIKMIEHVAPAGLGPLMQQANYAITVFGVSFFELLYLGIPTVVFSPYNGKDQRELDEIKELGVALVAHDEVEATGLLLDVMSDESLAESLSQRSRAMIGRSGTYRLCAEVADLMKS